MRKLIRAHNRQTRERKRFKRRAVAAGTAAAITLGAGVSLHKALAAYTPDLHELSVSQDADADLLANTEELAIGYHAFKGDQNRNETPDGVELAKQCGAIINQLPEWEYPYEDPEPNEIYKINCYALGQESCDICGLVLNMGGVNIVNPELGLNYPPGDPFCGDFLPFMGVHYMEHGSFSYLIDGSGNRVDDVGQLFAALGLESGYLYDPNGHQLSIAGDSDGDLLTDTEEAAAGYDANEPDQDFDLVPDGIALARQCREIIDGLPVYDPNPAKVTEPYKINYFTKGLESCDICGEQVNMGFWRIENPQLGLSIDVYRITCHYMSHGSFSYAGSVHHSGRIDVASLVEILEIPQRCSDFGTEFLAGDLNDDCEVNLADLGKLTERWLKDCSYFGTPYILGDLTEDCEIDLADFAGLADQWQQCTDPNE